MSSHESDGDVPYELIVSASNLIVDRMELHYGVPMTRPVADDLAERVLLLAARRKNLKSAAGGTR